LERPSIWFNWIKDGHKIAKRDETCIHEAISLVADHEKRDPYTVAVRQAHALGGKELIAILALAVGKSAKREMKKELKQNLPAVLAGKGWHLAPYITKYVPKSLAVRGLSC
jgi:hypothetical protein